MKYILLIFVCLTSCVTAAQSASPIIPKQGIAVIEYGADWCWACKKVAPILEQASKDMGFYLAHIDADKTSEKSYISYHKVFAIAYMPLISIFYNGRIFYHGGWSGKSDFVEMINMLQEKSK